MPKFIILKNGQTSYISDYGKIGLVPYLFLLYKDNLKYNLKLVCNLFARQKNFSSWRHHDCHAT